MSDHVSESIFTSGGPSQKNRRGSSVPSWLTPECTEIETSSDFSPSSNNYTQKPSLFPLFPTPTSEEQSPQQQHLEHHFSDTESEEDESSCSDDDNSSVSVVKKNMTSNVTLTNKNSVTTPAPLWARQQQQHQSDSDHDLTDSYVLHLDSDTERLGIDMEIASNTDSTTSFNGYSASKPC